MEWLQSNLALLSGTLVPLLLGVVKPLLEREAGGAELRRIERHARLRALLPEESEAAREIDKLLQFEAHRFAERGLKRIKQEIDVGNLVAIVFVSIAGGGISFGLVTWAQFATGFWAFVMWTAFGCWTLFVLLLVFVGGFSKLYTEKTSTDSI